MTNYMKLEIPAKSANEAFARSAVGAFVSGLDPTIEELADIKTAVSEGVTNAIIHGYENIKGVVTIMCKTDGEGIEITIKDTGVGIADIERAREPLYTSKPSEERSGMGFTVMESFMDHVTVRSEPGRGTEVIMTKNLDVGYEL